MSIFTPSIYNEPSFSGLFRLLDDFDNYRASTSAGQNNQQQQIAANGSANANQQRQLAGRSGGGGGLLGQMSFSPRFDLRETDTAFELRGDLPGVDKNQVHVEFADEHTLTIRGRVEREWSSSSGNDNTGTSSTEKSADATTSKDGEKQASSAGTSSSSVQQQQQQQSQTPAQAKYWITERSVGEFSRSFRLTGNHHHHHGGPAADGDVEIDHDGVTAKLDNGVLSVVVPKIVKEKKQAARKVQIH